MIGSRDFPNRPPRIELFSTVRPFYFVTFNTRERKKILACDAVFQAFLNFAEKAHTDYAIAVGRFVIMPDHIHLFVAIPVDGLQLSAWVKSLKSVIGKSLLQADVPKPHWQEGFFDHVLRSSESYSQKWDYVRQNPVRAKLIEKSEDWPWQGECVPIFY
jgi:REP element-mobilizing transposase RayT